MGEEAESLAVDPGEPGESGEPADDGGADEPNFIVRENAYGPGVHSVCWNDSEQTPVGVWLAERRPNADPAAVMAELLEFGLESKHAEAFADRRAVRMGYDDIEAYLISEWGEEDYFASAFYKARLSERRHEEVTAGARAALKAAR